MATVTLSMEAAIKLIPSYSGGNDADLSAFENKCEFVFSNITENIRPTILHAIIAQLTGKAFEAIRYREFTEWSELKNHFRTIFSTKNSVNFLQKALSSIRQEKNERIQDFAGRIEKIYHELTYALTIGKNATESKIIAQTIQGQALSVFMSGVHPAINTILEARAVITFELAVVIAMEKERNFEDRKPGKLITNENKKKQEGGYTPSNETNRTAGEIQNNVRVIKQMNEEHITCESDNFEPRNINLLIDSGADMNLIKITAVEKNVVVNEQDKRPIRGINSTLVYTLGSIVTPIQINEGTFIIKLSVVNHDFPIPGAGIIGRNFLKDNKVILDLSQELFIIPEPIKNNQIIIPPRSNCVLLIQNNDNIKHDHVTISKQDINEDVILANSISPVQGDKIISNVINISEQSFVIDELSTKNIKWEPYDEKVEEKASIYELCSEYADIFFLERDKLGATDIVAHNINTSLNLKPMNIRPYRLLWAFQEEIEKQVKQMKQDKIIRNSTSPFNFPLVVVKKKNLTNEGTPKLRICVDFRKLNEITENEAYGLPNLLEILESLGSSKYFSTLDLASGYHQIRINKVDTHKTAFSTKSGHYEYLRMPFGLSSAPATFTRAMKSVIMGLEEMCMAYLDDIVVHGASLRDHQEKLRHVFNRLRTHTLQLELQKCAFLRKEVLYLGYIINENGVSPDPKKIQCIKNYPRPKNPKDIKSFLGLLNYYWRFVDNFVKIAKPLTALLKKNVIFKWDDRCENAFEILKQALTNPPLLVYPDWEKGNFNLTTDASQYAIGAVLSQGIVPNDQPIAYASRTLNQAETNYSVIQKELLAIIWAVKHFRCYLYGRHFCIVTDHRPLTFLFGIKDVSSQLMRWRLQLSEYDYTIKYRAGTENSNADCLSRIRMITSEPNENETENTRTFNEFEIAENNVIFNSKIIEVDGSIKNANDNENIILPISEDCVTTHPAIKQIIQNHNLDNLQFQFFQIITEIKEFCQQNNINSFSTIRIEGTSTLNSYMRIRAMFRYIFKDSKITVTIYNEQHLTNEDKQQIIYEYHNTPTGGHSGISRTVKRLKLNYQWKNLKKDVKRYIQNCEVCQKNKTHRKTKQPMLITTTVTKAFERICLDIVGPLPITELGNTHILTMQDELTRYALAVALASTDATTVARAFVECCVCIFGIPTSILTDCGTNFLSDVFKNMCKLLDIEKSKTTPWHPQTNGYLERSHKTLKNYLRSFVDKDNNWDKLLCYSTFCYNTTVHTSTDFTPYELLFGRKPNIPSTLTREPEPQYNYDNYVFDLKKIMQETHKIARNNLVKKKENNKEYYDKTHNPITLHIGDKILLKDQNKKNTLVIIIVYIFMRRLIFNVFVPFLLLITVHGQQRFRDELLFQQSGIYFENRGPMKIVTSKWELTAFLNVTYFNNQYTKLKTYITLAESYCKIFNEQFNSTGPYCAMIHGNIKDFLAQIEKNKLLTLDSVGHGKRDKRAIFPTIVKTAKVIYGLCDVNCLCNSFLNLKKFRESGSNELKLQDKRIKIIEVKKNRDEEKAKPGLESIHELKKITSAHEVKGQILEHLINIKVLLDQYTFEINSLTDIIQTAKLGQIHPSLISPNELILQLKDIKVSLPSGTDLPIELDNGDSHEILQLSDMIIYYLDDNLVFKINLPLVYQHVLTLYYLLPKPVCNTDNYCIYTKSNHKYLAVSKSKELYSTYSELEQVKCKNARDFLLCPEISPLHPRNSKPICEILLIQDPKEVPDNCELMQIKIHARGRTFTLNETCKAYATRDILIPGEVNFQEEYLDFIPDSKINNINTLLENQLSDEIQYKNIQGNQMEDLNSIAKPLSEITEKSERNRKMQQIRQKQTQNDYLLYFMTTLILLGSKNQSKRTLIHKCILSLKWTSNFPGGFPFIGEVCSKPIYILLVFNYLTRLQHYEQTASTTKRDYLNFVNTAGKLITNENKKKQEGGYTPSNETNRTAVEHLNSEEKASIYELCSEYADIFFLERDKLGATDIVAHNINTSLNLKPMNIRPYRLLWAFQEEIEKQVKQMKQDKIIRNSTSPFNFPLVVVKKKNLTNEGTPKLRICVDFRKLNEITENEAYGLPNLLEILESLGSSKYFSTLDLASGYHQIRINKVDTHKTAFSTKSGHYEYLRMPFGLSSAPATFTRAMKSVIMGLEEMCMAYLDDIVVHGASLRDHQEKLRHVFNRLRTHTLQLELQKCAFLRKEVLYLGYIINENGVSPDPKKIQCIKNYPRPKNPKDIKSFLGLLNYYRRFVDNFVKIAKPLTALLKKNVIFKWDDRCENAFEILKQALTNPPLLVYPDWEKGNFNLTTDASQYAIGAVLSQGIVPNDQPIAYASRTLNQAETNYSVIQKELLAIIWAVKHFRCYLYGRHFCIVTDHRPLTFLFGIKDVSSQLMRWRLQLSEYDYTIKYRAGTENSNADCLSRIRMITSEPNENETENTRTFNEFEIAENNVIFNSKIIEVDGSIKNANDNENIILPISEDCVTTHPAIKQIIQNHNLDNLQFANKDKTIIFNRTNRLIILYNI
ncbi:hypothetical protein QTP88_020923 [Uroleucon formosanum]